MLLSITAIVIILFLGFANGSNDNLKGVSTLLGSAVATFDNARLWATVTTLLGSIAAVVLAQALLAKFTGKGLVPETVIGMKSFCLSVALAAALTVMLATRLGLPVSTTHALTGALVGAGWFASPTGVNVAELGRSFFIPLLISPLLALGLAVALYPVFRTARRVSKVKKETCVCIGNEVVGIVPVGTSHESAIALYTSSQTAPSLRVDSQVKCIERYQGRFLGVSIFSLMDSFHYLSAGAVGFARGLNDTPKMAALLLVTSPLSPAVAFSGIALVMAMGGFINGKKVAQTMSFKVTAMNAGQGFTANLVTSLIVIFASKLGFPVSTTHVACGSLFGIGVVTGTAEVRTIASIILAWVTTLPLAAFLGAVSFFALRTVV